MAISTSHRVPLLRGRIISPRDARSGLDVGGNCRVPSPSWSDQSTATGSRCDRKFKPVTLRQNQTAADIRAVISSLQDGLTLARICSPPIRAGKPYVTLGIVRRGALLAYRRANPE